jgi:hypothetical protein
MMSAVLTAGDKILVSHRRLFEGDEIRHFAGVVESYDSGIVCVTGWTYLQDPSSGMIFRKEDERTKLYAIASGTILLYRLPGDVDLAALRFEGRDGLLWLTDGRNLRMNMSERFADPAERSASSRWG